MKKLVFFTIIIISLLIIKNFVVSIYSLWQKQDIIVQAQKELDVEKKKNEQLKSKLSYAQSPQFIEEQARNKLFLVKPGEQQILIPKNLIQSQNQQKPQNQKPNWQEWWGLFYY